MVQIASEDAGLWESLQEMEARYSSYFAGLQHQLDVARNSFIQEQCALRKRVECTAWTKSPPASKAMQPTIATVAAGTQPQDMVDGPAARARAAPVLVSIAGIARHTAQEAGATAELVSLLEGPLESERVARAYDLARKAFHGQGLGTPGRRTLCIIRDLLVLEVCIGRGPWDNTSLLSAIKHAFNAFGSLLDDRVASQLVLAFNSIIRLGRGCRTKFNEAAAKMYGTALEPALIEGLFAAYVDCSRTSPDYLSKTKKSGKMKSKPEAEKNDHAEDSSASGSQTDADLTEPHTDLGVSDLQSSCSKGKTWLQRQEVETAQCEDQMLPQQGTHKECSKCLAPVLEGWKRPDGSFWCLHCLGRHTSSKGLMAQDIPMPSMDLGGPALQFSSSHPLSARAGACSSSIHQTEVRVVRSCCLEVAQAAGSRSVLLVHGREHGPLAEHKYGQGGAVVRASTLQQAVRATPGADQTSHVPPLGGIYIADVLVTKDGKGKDLEEPFRIAMLYASSVLVVDGEDSDERAMLEFRAEMREKVLNILRMCHEKNHDELILGAWGCRWRNAPRREVAAIFRAALFEDSDVVGLFRRVTFAIYGNEDDFRAFQDEFSPFCGPSNSVGVNLAGATASA